MTGLPDRLTALFAADAGRRVGIGHIARCRTLAVELEARGWSVSFALPAAARGSAESLEASGVAVLSLEQLLAGNTEVECYDLVAVDHYGLGWRDEARLRKNSRVILAMDDMANRGHDCDLLLDQTAGRQPEEYAPFVPPHARLLTGTDFAQVSRPFLERRPLSLERHRVQAGRILVSLGGSDAQRLSGGLAGKLAAVFPDSTVAVAMTLGAPGMDEVRRVEQDSGGRIQLLEGRPSLAEEMASADLAVGGAGTSSWERCCLGLPSLVIVLAPNQTQIARALEAAGAAREIPLDVSTQALREIGASLDLEAMSAASARLCDGLGVSRVAREIEAVAARSQVTLRPASESDSRFVWETNNEPSVRAVSLSTRLIPWAEHEAWFEGRLKDSNYIIFIVENGGCRAGVVRFQASQGSATVSIALSPEQRGKGAGAAAIRSGCRRVRRCWTLERIEAVIQERNVASQMAFQKAGFRLAGLRPDGQQVFVEMWPPYPYSYDAANASGEEGL